MQYALRQQDQFCPIDEAKSKDGTLHILVLLSTGGVHSHINHILAMLEMVAKKGLKNVAIHAILDSKTRICNVPSLLFASSIARHKAGFAKKLPDSIASLTREKSCGT
jgi:bisphosphoglycerate-independent phosphoglycerate mutase (AlkP superfamily)